MTPRVPAGAARLGEHLASGALLVLAAALAWVGWAGWRSAGAVALIGPDAVLRLTSDALKLVFDQERPCRAIAEALC